MVSTRDIRIEIRLKPHEDRAWRAAARQADLTLSEWLRRLGNAAAEPDAAAPGAPRRGRQRRSGDGAAG